MATEHVKNECEEQMELSSEDQALLDELFKEADSLLKEADVGKAENRFQEVVVTGRLSTSTKRLTIHDEKKWGGHYVKSPTNPLNKSGSFVHTAISELGAMAAVVYAGKNKRNQDCGWLAAWHVARGGIRKVYAECGPISKFRKPINWTPIEANLEKSGSSYTATCPQTGTKVSMGVIGSSGKAAVTASFSG